MEKAQFGFDWEGEVNFQVSYDIWEDWGWPENSNVNARGTRFDDVIDLRAGRLSTQDGFGGFSDYDDGKDVWDDDFFDEPSDDTGFDLWSWIPDETSEAVATDITKLLDFDGEEIDVGGYVDIFKVSDGTNDRFIAYDLDRNFVFDEVKASGDGWQIEFFGYDDSIDDGADDGLDANKYFEFEPGPGDVDKLVAENILELKLPDGGSITGKFNIYLVDPENNVYVAYDTDWEEVFDLVEGNVADGWSIIPIDDFNSPTGGAFQTRGPSAATLVQTWRIIRQKPT